LDNYSNLIKNFCKNSLHIYDAHNVDSELWEQQSITIDPKYKSYAIKALEIEKSLFKKVDSFICCSEVDYEKLVHLNQYKVGGAIIPNGVDIMAKPFDESINKNKLKNLLFCGSLNYFPNMQGLLWFYKDVFPLLKQQIPDISLTIIGNINCNKYYEDLIADTSVRFIGNVESVVPYYQGSSVAIVPLLSGSGTRLKLLEAMSMGNPVVSTTIGAEGIDYINGKHLLVADTAIGFADQIVTLINNSEHFDIMRTSALDFVKSKYSWEIIGDDLNNYLGSLTGEYQ
jgi:polysaccharide biosynthesis protein PslH